MYLFFYLVMENSTATLLKPSTTQPSTKLKSFSNIKTTSWSKNSTETKSAPSEPNSLKSESGSEKKTSASSKPCTSSFNESINFSMLKFLSNKRSSFTKQFCKSSRVHMLTLWKTISSLKSSILKLVSRPYLKKDNCKRKPSFFCTCSIGT